MKTSLRVSFVFVLIFTMLSPSFADENYEMVSTKVANDIYKIWTITFNEALDPSTVNTSTVFVKNAFNRHIEVSVNLSGDGKSITVTPSQMYVPGLEYELHITKVASIDNEILSPAVKMPFIIEQLKEEKPSYTKNDNSSSEPSINEQQSNNSSNSGTTSDSPFSSRPTTSPQAPSQQPSTSNPQQPVQKLVHLTSIKVDVKPMVSNVTIKTSNFVAVVKINGKKMHYQGNNIYELAIPGLKSGSTIKVEAFSSYDSRSLLEQTNHNVK